MPFVARLRLSGPCKQSCLVIGLLVSIALHGLVLATYFGQRVDIQSPPQVHSMSKFNVTLQPSGMPKEISSNDAVDNHPVSGMTPRPTRLHQNRASRQSDQRHLPDFDLYSERPDTLPNGHHSSPSPSIDIDAAREMARALGRESAGEPTARRGRQDMPALERETALGSAIAKAARPDCRTAQFNKSEIGRDFTFTATGLFVIPYLVKGALTDGGCKW